jgi:nucleoside phosphorylase
VIAWADAEWAAIHHVFCASNEEMPHSAAASGQFPGWAQDTGTGEATASSDWGWLRLVQVGGARVLLYKSNVHYAHQGAARLTAFTKRLTTLPAPPGLVVSTGTAGGANQADHVGTVVIVNAATLYDASQPAGDWPRYASSWRPDAARLGAVAPLLKPIPITGVALTELAEQFDAHEHTSYTLSQLDPLSLNEPSPVPEVHDLTGASTSLLTAGSFLVGTTDDAFAAYGCIEMDDAIVAAECLAANVLYGSVRNLSDPAQPADLGVKGGSWGSAVYRVYGLYTSFNGALAACAAVSGATQDEQTTQ